MGRTAAILLSRQPLRPCRTTPWVAQTAKAVAWVKAQGLALCSSTGMQTWELITALASLENVPLKLILPSAHASDTPESHCDQSCIPRAAVEYVNLEVTTLVGKEASLLCRDRAIVEAADVLVPVSVRAGGHMESLIEHARTLGKECVEQFRVERAGPAVSLSYTVNASLLNPELDALGTGFLIHWTRASNSAWPGERLIDYWQAVLASSTYPRTAYHTLRRILSTKQLIASPRHMPGNIPTVAFSALSPRAVVPLMRWRARYTQMSFEPYGIGLKARVAERLGLYPVQYYSGKAPEKASGEDCWLWQSEGVKSDWRQEREYRHRGDLSLGSVSSEDLMVFTQYPNEAVTIEQEFGVRAVSMHKRSQLLDTTGSA